MNWHQLILWLPPKCCWKLLEFDRNNCKKVLLFSREINWREKERKFAAKQKLQIVTEWKPFFPLNIQIEIIWFAFVHSNCCSTGNQASGNTIVRIHHNATNACRNALKREGNTKLRGEMKYSKLKNSLKCYMRTGRNRTIWSVRSNNAGAKET